MTSVRHIYPIIKSPHDYIHCAPVDPVPNLAY